VFPARLPFVILSFQGMEMPENSIQSTSVGPRIIQLAAKIQF
jgi:hypothetical protein